ncbi:MAG: YihY family inner membrane protein [Phycisphaerales bacterium]|nr:YihY family inner membrane protein [Phycisphaerales bacterium]
MSPQTPKRTKVDAIQRVLGGRPIAWEGGSEDTVQTGLVRSVFHVLHLLLVGIRRTQLTRMAAALAYRTMFGIIPVIVVIAVALAAFTSQARQQEVIKGMLTYAGLNQIKVEDRRPKDAQPVLSPAPGSEVPQPDAGAPGSGGAAASGAGAGGAVPESQAASLDEWINERAVSIAQSIKKLPFNLIGLVAILTLLYAAMSMLVEIEHAFNEIYLAPQGRSWARRIAQYWTLLTLGPILLIASFTISHYLTDSADSIARLGGDTYAVHLKEVLRYMIAAAVSSGLLLLIYVIVPNTRVQPLPAALGALVAGVLWESSKAGFTAYVGFATREVEGGTNLSNLYGTVAILPLFLVWVYLSWLIILFGLQLAYSMQTYWQASAKGLTLSVLAALGLIEDPNPAGRPRLIDPASILAALAAVAERFRDGKSSDHNHIAEATGLHEKAVALMLARLADDGLLLPVSGSSGRLEAYALARPPETIDALRVIRLAEDLGGAAPPGETPARIARQLAEAKRAALRGKSLADFLPPAPPAEGGSPSPARAGA